MPIRPCPTCRKPVEWNHTSTRPFCSERCRILDLGAWSAESYRIPAVEEEAPWEPSEDSEP